MSIYYCDGYKFQLQADADFQTGITGHEIDIQFILFAADGRMTVKRGYAWDGATGLPIQFDHILRASLCHDALYQLMREGLLDLRHRLKADRLFRAICIEDGMPRIMAAQAYALIRLIGERFAEPQPREVHKAP